MSEGHRMASTKTGILLVNLLAIVEARCGNTEKRVRRHKCGRTDRRNQRRLNVVAQIEEIKDAFDPIGLKKKVDSIYENLPATCQEVDVILDFTGMTALASVGSVLACLDESRAIQYVPAEYNDKGQPIKPLDPIEIVLT